MKGKLVGINREIIYENISENIPTFLLGGSILVLNSKVSRATNVYKLNNGLIKKSIKILLSPNFNNFAKGIIYVDDENSFLYKSMQFILGKFEFSQNKIRYKILNNKYQFPIVLNCIQILGQNLSSTTHLKAYLRYDEVCKQWNKSLNIYFNKKNSSIIMKKIIINCNCNWVIEIFL